MDTATTFGERAEQYLCEISTRKRINTLASYRSYLRNRIIPAIGGVKLGDVKNGTAKQLARCLAEAGLSPATIRFAVTVVISVMDSILDTEGQRVYPTAWNWDFILGDVPEVDPVAPVATLEAISQAISAAPVEGKALIALLAGSGLRIGEALALKGQDDGGANLWDPEKGTIQVRATRVRGGVIQPMPKTKAGNRVVDLDPALNCFLKSTLGDLKYPQGLLFPKSGVAYANMFKSVGLDGGFHSLRRARETYLEAQGVPRMLMKFWTGHAAGDITERYIKFGPQVEERRQMAFKAGLGFAL